LERLSAVVDFELFRADLERAVVRSDRSRGGRPPFDHVLVFKVLILQSSHNLSDERTEYLICDRLSFMRFLGLGLADTVPAANTIWGFREALRAGRSNPPRPSRARTVHRALISRSPPLVTKTISASTGGIV
jgi:IS5 family transposase